MKKCFMITILCMTMSPGAFGKTICGNVVSASLIYDYGAGTDTPRQYYILSDSADHSTVLEQFDTNECVCINCTTESENGYSGCTAYDDTNWPYPGYGYPSDWQRHCTTEPPEPETCAWDEYLDGLTCVPCPAGSYGSYASHITHQSTECGYCDNNYYWNDGAGQCQPCPSGGRTGSPLYQNNHISITKCYLPANTPQTNSTGTWVYTHDCYWSN